MSEKIIGGLESRVKLFHETYYPYNYKSLCSWIYFKSRYYTEKGAICLAKWKYIGFKGVKYIAIPFRFANHDTSTYRKPFTAEEVQVTNEFYRWITNPQVSPWRDMLNEYFYKVITDDDSGLIIGIILSCDIPTNLLVNFCIGSRFAIEYPHRYSLTLRLEKDGWDKLDAWFTSHFYEYGNFGNEDYDHVCKRQVSTGHSCFGYKFQPKLILNRKYNKRNAGEPFNIMGYDSSDVIWRDENAITYISMPPFPDLKKFISIYKGII